MDFVRKEPARLFLLPAGCFCLLFGLIPALLYRIGHSGVAVLLLGAGFFFALAAFWPRMAKPLRRGVLVLMALVLLLASVLSVFMVRQAWFRSPPDDRPVTVIVLGGKVNGRSPSLMLARRLLAAAEYLESRPDALCVVSGGQGPDESYPEAQVMAEYLVRRGIEPSRILREDKSTSTEENLSFSVALLEEETGTRPREIAIATDGFHQLRASVYAGALGLECYSIPSGTPWGLMPSYWVREWMGLPVAWLIIR